MRREESVKTYGARAGRGCVSLRAVESNVPFISNVERGVMMPGLAMLLRLADALDCSVCDLVEVFDANRRKRQHKRGSASTRKSE